MLIAKLLFFAIIYITLLQDFVHSRTFDYEDYDYISPPTNQFLGTWYLVAIVTRTIYPEILLCMTRNVTETANYEYVKNSAEIIQNGVADNYEWLMKIGSRKLHIYSYNNDTLRKVHDIPYDLLVDSGIFALYNITAEQLITIYSREKDVTTQSLSVYKNLVKYNNWNIQYVNYELCRVRNTTQENIDKDIATNLLGEWFETYYVCPKNFAGTCSISHTNLSIVRRTDGLLFAVNRKVNGKNAKTLFKVKVFYSQLHGLYNHNSKFPVYGLEFYNNGTEVYMINESVSECSIVISRDPITPKESTKRYRAIAKKIDQVSCPIINF